MSEPNTPNNGSDQEPEIIEVVNLYKKREKIYTRSFQGFFRSLRISGGALLFILYFGVAWISVTGRQAVLFDLPARQFHIFGATFYPQDFILLSCLLIICAFGLFFITVLAGRIWCGYTCPQSVFTWVFMWAEHITEGDRNQRMKLDKAEMSSAKFLRKALKHLLWLAIALATGITFVGYFTPIRELVPNLLTLDVHPWALFWIGFFTLATYGNAGWLREQVCIYMCPYARFQSVMYDENTATVWYDPSRGESRGPRKKTADHKAQGLGDCIDCKMCVHVCPTGIDIRDGLQYECIGCAACIDACDSIMDKMGYDKGLIRYSTENEIVEGKPGKIIRPRLVGYFVALTIITVMFLVAASSRSMIELEILRDRQSLYTETVDGLIENVYTLKLVNKDQKTHRYHITIAGLDGLRYEGDKTVEVASGELLNIPVRLVAPPAALKGKRNATVIFTVKADVDTMPPVSTESRFLAPAPR